MKASREAAARKRVADKAARVARAASGKCRTPDCERDPKPFRVFCQPCIDASREKHKAGKR